jgi:exopolysaccharide production protein ExoY
MARDVDPSIPKMQAPAASAPSRARFSTPPTGPRDSSRAIVFGLLRDVPRALEHPAFRGPRFTVVGILPVDEDPNIEATVLALQQLIAREGAGTLLAAGPVGHELMARASDVAFVNRCRLVAVMPTEVLAAHDPIVVWEGERPLVQLSRNVNTGWQPKAKRALDVVGASILLAALSPLLALAVVAIRLESRGPAFFRHRRVGKGGDRFSCLKLRTMRQDAEEVLQNDAELRAAYIRNDYKLPDHADPRVTALGRILRRTSLDEVPQLWNVIVGEMSLVGPRPLIAEELEHYAGTSSVLLSVRPGVTGAWAVSGRHHVGYPKRAELELGYVRRWSLATDLRILAKTFGAVLDPGSEPVI